MCLKILCDWYCSKLFHAGPAAHQDGLNFTICSISEVGYQHALCPVWPVLFHGLNATAMGSWIGAMCSFYSDTNATSHQEGAVR